MTNIYKINGFRTLNCQCPHRVELLSEPEEQPGVTIWRHGENGEAAMVVTPEMRREWALNGMSAVAMMFKWIERVHAYERHAFEADARRDE